MYDVKIIIDIQGIQGVYFRWFDIISRCVYFRWFGSESSDLELLLIINMLFEHE